MINLKKITVIFVCVFLGNSFLMGMDEVEGGRSRYDFGFISSVSISPNNKYYASVFSNGLLQLWQLYSKQIKGPILQVENANGIVSFSPDDSRGTLIAYGLKDGFVKIMRVETQESVLEFKAFNAPIDIVAFSPDGRFLAVVSLNEINICEVIIGTRVKSLVGHSNFISSLQWSPDGSYIASGDINGNVIIWDAQMECQICNIKGDGICSACVAWSQDAKYLAIGSNNKIVICEKGENCRFERFVILQQNVSNINAISWHPSGAYIVTVADRVARLWDAKNCECLQNLTGAIYSTNSAAFSSDGNSLVMNLGSRSISNRRVCEILKPSKCAICGKENCEDLVEKIPEDKSSCLVCSTCKARGRERIPFIPCII